MELNLLNQLDGFECSEYDPESNEVQTQYERPTISSQMQGRRKITIVTGLKNRIDPRSKKKDKINLDKLCSEFKAKFAVGGCVKTDKESGVSVIQLQGEVKPQVHQFMIEKLGITDKEILVTGV